MRESCQKGEAISCGAVIGCGGLGRHLEQVVLEAQQADRLCAIYSRGDGLVRDAEIQIPSGRFERLIRLSPLRYSPGWMTWASSFSFDRQVAGKLKPATVFRGFDGMALVSYQQARSMKFEHIEHEAAMSHIDNVCRTLARAHAQYPLEGSPFKTAFAERVRAEYEQADVIWVSSDYSRRSFLEFGIPERKLRQRALTLPSRFRNYAGEGPDGIFRIVYSGAISIGKGIPVLLEAFSKLKGAALLTLVGSTGSRAMKKFIAAALAKDARIVLAPGDPLPHLKRADVYVHPSFQDGFGYAPMEAMACGVPVIVTNDTGMKEHVIEGQNGYVVDSGDWKAILNRLEALRLTPLRGKRTSVEASV